MQQLKALYDLSDIQRPASPEQLTTLINDAPDPEAAVRAVYQHINTHSEALQRKWRQLIVQLWSAHHPHLPDLLALPIATEDVSDVPAVQDAVAFLTALNQRPANLVYESKEWLLASADAHYFATLLPSRGGRPLIQLENEWQYMTLRRLRATLQSLRLIRRVGNKLLIVKSRYQRFNKLPAIQQFYLLWHTETYHVDWSQFSGLWGEYIHIIQEYVPLLWDLSEGALPDMTYDIRGWNQDVWDTYHALWAEEGLLDRRAGHIGLLSLVRIHSLPTALTQVIMRDLLERYGLTYGEGDLYAWTSLGTSLTHAERTQELPCALDLLK